MRISIPQILGAFFFCFFSFWNFLLMIVTLGHKPIMAAFLNFECKLEMAVFGSPIRLLRDESGISRGTTKPILLISNHQSLLDILVLYAIMPFPLSFIAKKELFSVPFLNFHLWATGALRIDRNSPRRAYKDMEHAAKVLKKRSLFIFPEGTRQTNDAIGNFKRGFLKLALDAGADLVPVVTRGTANIMKKNSLKVGKGNEVKVIIGRVWTNQELQSDDAANKIHDWFVSSYQELKSS